MRVMRESTAFDDIYARDLCLELIFMVNLNCGLWARIAVAKQIMEEEAEKVVKRHAGNEEGRGAKRACYGVLLTAPGPAGRTCWPRPCHSPWEWRGCCPSMKTAAYKRRQNRYEGHTSTKGRVKTAKAQESIAIFQRGS